MSPHVLPSHCSPASMIPSPQIPPKGVMQPEVSSTQALVQDKSPSVKSPRSVQFRMGPKFLPSHCSPGLMKPSPQLVPLPPKHEAVLNWHAASQLRLPRGKPKSLHPVTLPHEELSHCSPASITPSPQFPPVREVHAIVSKAQDGPQRRTPPANPRLEQPETGPQLAPSHCSPWSITPSPQELPAPPWHAAVSNWQSPPQVSAPETNASKSAQLLTVPHEVRSHCSPESIVPSPQFPPVVVRHAEVSKRQLGVHERGSPRKLSKSEHSRIVPHAVPSHCSPCPIRPSPHLVPLPPV